MKLLTLLLLFVTAATLSAQTKQIAHRSHSGAPSTFVLSATPDNLGIGFHYEPEPEPDTLTVIDSVQAQKPSPAPAIVPPQPAEPEPVQTTEPAAEPSISKEQSQAGSSAPVSMSRVNSSKDLEKGSLTWLLLGCVLPAIAFAARGFFGERNEES